MSKTLEGMARAWWSARGLEGNDVVIDAEELEGMRRAALFLADNVTDEMVDALAYEFHKPEGSTPRKMLSAALRAAAEGET